MENQEKIKNVQFSSVQTAEYLEICYIYINIYIIFGTKRLI